jgi:starvation-inducible DNA-binding protein
MNDRDQMNTEGTIENNRRLSNEHFTMDGNPTPSPYDLVMSEKLNSKSNKMARSRVIAPDVVGISEIERSQVCDGLEHLLADTYLLYLKTQNYHWNVGGSHFLTLHNLFLTQYTDLSLAVDLIAERIRALGQSTPGTLSEFFELTSLKEDRSSKTSTEMLESLIFDQNIVIAGIRKVIHLAAEGNDFATVDLLTQRLQIHEKNAWMLKSFRGS